MANIQLKTLKLHGLDGTYVIHPDPEYMPITIEADGWEGDEAPYIYTLNSPEFDGKTIEVVEDVNMTMEQLEVIERAKIKSDPRRQEYCLYAFGEKPTIDVPVLLIVR